MAKKKSASYMTPGEQIAGVVFLTVYLLALPFVTEPMFRFVGGLLDMTFSAGTRSLVYYGGLLAVTLVMFHSFLLRTSQNLADDPGTACRSFLTGLVGLYGLNELAYRLTRLVISHGTNLNDTSISAQVQGAPQLTLLVVALLAPVVEETLFRGLVFGNLKQKSRTLAYLASALLFALFHVWQFAAVSPDWTHFLLLIQYLIPGFVLSWAYESSGTLWAAVGIHAAANALNLWMVY